MNISGVDTQQETLIVVGGLSAGPAAAAKARRENENMNILLFEKGNEISYATCGMPYFLSGKIDKIEKLRVVTPERMKARFGIDVHLNEEVLSVDPAQKQIKTSKGSYRYDRLVWATGASSILPPIKGLKESTKWSAFRTLDDLIKIKEAPNFVKAKKVGVLGGGLIGVEVAENLRELGLDVALLEAAPHILPQWGEEFALIAEGILKNKGMELYAGAFLAEVQSKKEHLKLILSNGQDLEVDYLILSAGIRPNTQILKEVGAEVLGNGALKVDAGGRTNLPDIYAAGDASAVMNFQTGVDDYIPMGTHSNKAGRAAGANAVGGSESYTGGYGTAIIKLFEYTFARTGMHPLKMRKEGIDFRTTTINAGATPSYYPGQENMTVRLYWAPDGKLLGAELFGKYGVDKRVDVLATALFAKLNIIDLPRLDLAYAPPFSPAKDPVAVAGFVAENQMRDACLPISIAEMTQQINRAEYLILDVRTAAEIKKVGRIPNSINIPLEELRERLQEIPTGRPIAVYCAAGMRGYLAVRLLKHKGFADVRNLEGGFMFWERVGGKVERI